MQGNVFENNFYKIAVVPTLHVESFITVLLIITMWVLMFTSLSGTKSVTRRRRRWNEPICSTIQDYPISGGKHSLRWRHNDQDGVSNHQPHGCLLNRLFRRRSNKTSKLRVTGLCVGNSPGPVNSPHKGPVTRKMFPFDDVIMFLCLFALYVMPLQCELNHTCFACLIYLFIRIMELWHW